jgi:hypothetical protein
MNVRRTAGDIAGAVQSLEDHGIVIIERLVSLAMGRRVLLS